MPTPVRASGSGEHANRDGGLLPAQWPRANQARRQGQRVGQVATHDVGRTLLHNHRFTNHATRHNAPMPIHQAQRPSKPNSQARKQASKSASGKLVGLNTEHTDQVRLVMRVRTFLPDVLLVAVPNGVHTTAAQRLRLINEGMLSGFPDLMLFAPGKTALCVEMKREVGGRLSPAQKACHARLNACGVEVITCHGFDAAWDAVKKWHGGHDAQTA